MENVKERFIFCSPGGLSEQFQDNIYVKSNSITCWDDSQRNNNNNNNNNNNDLLTEKRRFGDLVAPGYAPWNCLMTKA